MPVFGMPTSDDPPFADVPFPERHQPRSPQAGPRQLRASRRKPVRICLVVLAVHVLIAILGSHAEALLALPLAGPFNVGLGLLMAQLCMTAGVAVWYGRYARAAIDPVTEDHEFSLSHPENHR